MCKANSHTEDSNAKTLPNSCLEAARFVPENCGIHAGKSRYPCSKATIFMLEQHENHLQTPRKSCSKAAEFTSKPKPSVVGPHGITRSASLPRIPNVQHASGMVFDDTEPAPRRASPHRATSHHRRPSSRASTAPNRIAVAGRYRRLPSHNAASPSKITGKRAASPTTGRRRCDSTSRSSLCARALPRRPRLQFRAANEFSWWRQSTQHRKTA